MPQSEIYSFTYEFSTRGEGEFIDLTGVVQNVVKKSGVKNGLVHAFAPHATGVLILSENDPALLKDIEMFVERLAPSSGQYSHPSNAHSHLRSILFPPDRTLPVLDGRVVFGTWQSLLFMETDVHPRKRSVIFQVLGHPW